MENLLFLGVPILKHIRVTNKKRLFCLRFFAQKHLAISVDTDQTAPLYYLPGYTVDSLYLEVEGTL